SIWPDDGARGAPPRVSPRRTLDRDEPRQSGRRALGTRCAPSPEDVARTGLIAIITAGALLAAGGRSSRADTERAPAAKAAFVARRWTLGIGGLRAAPILHLDSEDGATVGARIGY